MEPLWREFQQGKGKKMYKKNNTPAQKVDIFLAVVSILSLILLDIWIVCNVKEYLYTPRLWIYFCAVLILVSLIVLLLLYYLISNKKWNTSKLFVCLAFFACTSMQLAMPPLSGTDESAHYFNAYMVSNYILGIEDTKGAGDIMMRRVDAERWQNTNHLNDNFSVSYDALAHDNWFNLSEEDKEIVYYENKAWIYKLNPFRYVIPGVGIAVARILGLGFAPTIFLGRFMNSLFFILCGWVAIKIMPRGQWSVITLLFVPRVLNLVSSYSYDTLAVSMTILIVALIMRMYYLRVEMMSILALGVCSCILAMNKGVYIFIVVLIFAIPYKKWKSWWQDFVSVPRRKTAIYIVICLVLLLGSLFMYKFGVGYYISVAANSDNLNLINGKQPWSIGFALNHPMETLILWKNTFFARIFWVRFLQCVGLTIGHTDLLLTEVPEILVAIITCVLVWGIIRIETERIDGRVFVCWLIAGSLVIFAVAFGCMILFTPITSTDICGSGRYFVPVLIMTIMIWAKEQEEKKDMIRVYLVESILMITVLYTNYGALWNR